MIAQINQFWHFHLELCRFFIGITQVCLTGIKKVETSVVDPDPDPELFEGSGSGSGINSFGSGSG
jgi:hypothetical protein